MKSVTKGGVTGTYTHDKNGNMINDSRKALNLSYNVLNLLSEVKTTAGILKARYSYLADGRKLRVRDNGEVNGFDYTGSLTYRKSSAGLQLESANFGSGVIHVIGSTGNQQEVNYVLTDHLGSVRVIVDGNGAVKERNDYYPFGARHARSDYVLRAGNRLKYNGKEEQVTGDLDFLDYGWRMYDSGLGRWFGMDPLTESSVSWSPYRYGLNNPIYYRDVAGLWEKTEYGWSTNDASDINRFMSMIDFETLIYGGVSEAQFFMFIQEEYDGIGGRLSNGSILLSEQRAFKFNGGNWRYAPYDQNIIADEINKFGNQMKESNILSSSSFYTYKYFREKSWERQKAKFPLASLTGYACGALSKTLWNNSENTRLSMTNLKKYSTRFYGNQYFSSGKVKTWKSVAKYTSSGLKWIGKGLGVYGLVGTAGEYYDGKLSLYGALYVGAADISGLTNNPLGSAWSLGTSLGKYIVESNWYFDLIHGGRRW